MNRLDRYEPGVPAWAIRVVIGRAPLLAVLVAAYARRRWGRS